MGQELRLNGAAQRAGVTPRTIIDWIANNELEATWHYGTGWHIASTDLDRAIRAHRP
ncbi:helix-turn-helix domain-containing protein [Frankia sp. CcI49]|uniref:helix-turn-helix domain-containing protein n=1 Tax=Frankia sp. CcI49 TaxID=1745382 RepID=UPI000E2E99FB|nr:helix-turn-helix domain-containing protein [Frankia sp. CcI49]